MTLELNDKTMTPMKFFRTLFIAAALVSTHWMGMSMARAFAAPAETQAAQVPVEEVVEQPAEGENTVPVRAAVAG